MKLRVVYLMMTIDDDDDDDDDDDKLCLTLFPASTLVRDSHHSESPTQGMQGMNLHRT